MIIINLPSDGDEEIENVKELVDALEITDIHLTSAYRFKRKLGDTSSNPTNVKITLGNPDQRFLFLNKEVTNKIKNTSIVKYKDVKFSEDLTPKEQTERKKLLQERWQKKQDLSQTPLGHTWVITPLKKLKLKKIT